MILNTYGEIAQKQWLWLGNQYNYIKLDEYVVMPNHVHGILVIDNKNVVNTSPRHMIVVIIYYQKP